MDPVFIRRGDVLFIVKSPQQFIRNLQAGKFLPTDCILAKNQQKTEWIPLNKVHQFRLESVFGDEIDPSIHSFYTDKLFDRIRKPRFNISAFTFGGFWYFFNRMPHLAWKRLCLSGVTLGLLFALGLMFNLPFSHLVPLALIGWFSTASISAVRADYDYNRLQIQEYQSDTQKDDHLSISDANGWSTPDIWADSPVRIVPTWKEKILN